MTHQLFAVFPRLLVAVSNFKVKEILVCKQPEVDLKVEKQVKCLKRVLCPDDFFKLLFYKTRFLVFFLSIIFFKLLYQPHSPKTNSSLNCVPAGPEVWSANLSRLVVCCTCLQSPIADGTQPRHHHWHRSETDNNSFCLLPRCVFFQLTNCPSCQKMSVLMCTTRKKIFALKDGVVLRQLICCPPTLFNS